MKHRAPWSRRTAPNSSRQLAELRTELSPQVDKNHPRRRAFITIPLLATLLLSSFWGLTTTAQADPFKTLRHSMVDEQIRKRGVKQPSVLSALETVPRHLFVPETQQPIAYDDTPVTFAPGHNLPHAIVSARMIELLELDGNDKVLEIGTGSGYDAALLSRVAGKIYTIEIDQGLGRRARNILDQLGFDNVEVKIGDGYRGWPEKAPFDAILVTVSTPEPPPPLYDQLKMGGKMVVAVGELVQEMQLITKTPEGRLTRPVSLVNLGPMTGEVKQRE
ncbi:MAG: protein-L-isoaspartate O-methyltransferase [Acidobacteriota bacterium]